MVAILGPRQVGKTTLAREIATRFDAGYTHFDLEDPDDLSRLSEPKLALGRLTGLVVIDEIQLRPDLFPLLRVLVDRPHPPARFLILGSASPQLLRQSSESLAGRIVYHELDGFSLDEVKESEKLWLRGGFPPSFLAPDDSASFQWRRDFIRTFLERDIPQLGIRIPAATLHRFWSMVAHYHGQIWNGNELARAFGMSHTTVRHYLDILIGALVVRQLLPWHENLGKRQVKAPKIYLADSGLLHALLKIQDHEDLERHPKVGASWEGFVLHEIRRLYRAEPEECFFWATHGGAELDLLIMRGQKRFGFEIKRTTSPRLTPSMISSLESLKLDRLVVIHAGDHEFPLADGIEAVPFARMKELLRFHG
ncbi:ATP-binding protein [Geobacter sp.]|uniref:ATP-binding protein n=1 Tax=Geobacter sp. TaxID=46610 RepID=UPI003457D0D7